MDKSKIKIDAKVESHKKGGRRNVLNSRPFLISVSVLLSVIISCLAYFLVVYPQWQRVGPNRELDVAAVQETLDARKSYASLLNRFLDNYDSIPEEDISLMTRIFPLEPSVPELFSQLDIIARQSSANLKSVRITEVEQTASSRNQKSKKDENSLISKHDNLREVLLKINFEVEDYEKFKKFLSSIESHVRLIDIESLQFEPDEIIPEDEEKPIEISRRAQSINAKTYFFSTDNE